MSFVKKWLTKRIDETIPDENYRLGVARAIMQGDEDGKPGIIATYREICTYLKVNIFTAHYLIKQVRYRDMLSYIVQRETQKEKKRKLREKQRARNLMQEREDRRQNEKSADQAMRNKCLESAHKAYVQYAKKELKMAEKSAIKQRKAIEDSFEAV